MQRSRFSSFSPTRQAGICYHHKKYTFWACVGIPLGPLLACPKGSWSPIHRFHQAAQLGILLLLLGSFYRPGIRATATPTLALGNEQATYAAQLRVGEPTATPSAPDLSLSSKSANRASIDYFQPVDYTIVLPNAGGPAQVQITDTLPVLLSFLPDTLASTKGNATYSAAHNVVLWSGFIAAGETVTITFGMAGPTPIVPHDTRIENSVVIDDGVHAPFARTVTILANPWPTPTPTVTSTSTTTPTATATVTSTPLPSNTPRPTITGTQLPTHTPTYTPTPTPTPTNTVVTPTVTPVVATIVPDTGGALHHSPSSDTQLTVQVPPHAVTETVALLLQMVTPQSTPIGFAFGGQSFTLDVAIDHTVQDDYHFQQPITVTIDYNPDLLVKVAQEHLLLFFFDEAAQGWVDAATTCTPAARYARQPAENRFSLVICHLTEFGVFGQEAQRLYLPYVQR